MAWWNGNASAEVPTDGVRIARALCRGASRELSTLGLEELLDQDAVVLVEWGKRFPWFWPPDHLEIELRTLEGEQREIRLDCASCRAILSSET